MKKVPSALKWLAETRARTAGRIASKQQSLQLLSERVGTLEAELAQAKEYQQQLVRQVAQLEKDLENLDGSVTVFDPGIDPSAIGVVNGWQGKYGERGTFRGCLLALMEQHAPNYVPTTVLAAHAISELSLTFATSVERTKWYTNSLRDALKKMEKAGQVERSPGALLGSDEKGWRIKQESIPTLAELRARQPGG